MFPWLLVLHFIGQCSDFPSKSIGMYNMETCFGLSCKTIYFIQLSEGLVQKQKKCMACMYQSSVPAGALCAKMVALIHVAGLAHGLWHLFHLAMVCDTVAPLAGSHGGTLPLHTVCRNHILHWSSAVPINWTDSPSAWKGVLVTMLITF